MQEGSEQYLTVLLNSAGGPSSHAGEYQIAETTRFSKKLNDHLSLIVAILLKAALILIRL